MKHTYSQRRELLKEIVQKLNNPKFQLIEQYNRWQQKELWNEFIMKRDYEGLMFKDPNNPIDGLIYRMKKVVTWDYVISGFENSESDS